MEEQEYLLKEKNDFSKNIIVIQYKKLYNYFKQFLAEKSI